MVAAFMKNRKQSPFYGIGNCLYSSGTPARIALAILGVQSAGFALFYGIGNCSYSRGTPTRIALAILGVQSAGFALFYAVFSFDAGKSVLYFWSI